MARLRGRFLSRWIRAHAPAHVVGPAAAAVLQYAHTYVGKTPYRTGSLSGDAWVTELLNGHSLRIKTELGVSKEVFEALILVLQDMGYQGSRYISLEEQLAIFLYSCTSALSTRRVGERFQHSTGTISRYFKKMLLAFAGPAFYNRYVVLPRASDSTPSEIKSNPKFYPFFKDAIGAIDGTHLSCHPSMAEHDACRNRKGALTQNCLACCSFDLRFQYILSGWEGSASDAFLYNQARLTSLSIPPGKYFLADAGFGICNNLITPFRGVRYHLRKWGRAGQRPKNAKELFNLRHASACNVIERIFGIFKRRFPILIRPPEYSMEIQARIPAALAAVHNFIRIYDPNEININPVDETPGARTAFQAENLAQGPTSRAEAEQAEGLRDKIAKRMWRRYKQVLQDRGITI